MAESDSGSGSAQSHQVRHYDLQDALVYKLSNKLGGRSEVIGLPVLDALNYLIIVMDEEERKVEEDAVERYMNHMSRVLAQPPQNEEQTNARRNFIEQLEPKSFKKPKVITDQATLDQILARQEAQMKQLN